MSILINQLIRNNYKNLFYKGVDFDDFPQFPSINIKQPYQSLVFSLEFGENNLGKFNTISLSDFFKYDDYYFINEELLVINKKSNIYQFDLESFIIKNELPIILGKTLNELSIFFNEKLRVNNIK